MYVIVIILNSILCEYFNIVGYFDLKLYFSFISSWITGKMIIGVPIQTRSQIIATLAP